MLNAEHHDRWLPVTGSGQQHPPLTVAGRGIYGLYSPNFLSLNRELGRKPAFYLVFQLLYPNSPCIGFLFPHLCMGIDNIVWSLQFWIGPSSLLWTSGLWSLLATFTHDNYNWRIFLDSDLSRSFIISKLPGSSIHTALTNSSLPVALLHWILP